MNKSTKIILSLFTAAALGVGIAFITTSVTRNNSTSSLSATSGKKSQTGLSSSSKESNKTQSSASSSSSTYTGGPDYDPNLTADGTEITDAMIDSAIKELTAAGIPADSFARSDIKTIIRKASETNESIVQVAKQNAH
ncbi:MAG: hypothetical protein LBM27_02355 [Lactobacillaceae bacterium]|jgi:hypothetical protein|nr:hypothetical protein [Lactobacillaceae bacterium]